MDKSDLIRLALAKATEHNRGGKMTGKTVLALAVIGVVVLVAFIAYRLILVELITSLSHK
ncbi:MULTISPECIES: hypothetical protein [unclassified Amycolatopsis]|uniref:hypothetical protein n=1 Tax=unclassified Amycolatopsis TaxID=2618356 RepID=UPI002E11A232|nr:MULTISPECIES: hypothetical protein [unclassified Amycolatopsis]WSJ75639.1 hypothetical protein OG439_40495 [Amycolatopsis sp. NBC_01307]WSK80726.1 hypothetical protein OG570_09250 [Amycolatopsis sp. NBC_01286]